MFDIGFSELLVIAVVALLVLGPERLPKAARFAGLWVRRARAQWHSVKSELERDLAAEDLRRSLHDTQAAMREAQAALREAGGDARRGLDTLGDGLMQGTSPPPAIAAPDATQTGAADAPPEIDDRAR
jgi:sec-independent protein translocase protein TatB